MASVVHHRAPITAVCLRLLLMVSLWQAPIPWCHQHAADSADLATHLALFHKGDSQACRLGWHYHFSLPECDSSGDANQLPCSLPRTIGDPAVVVTSDALSISALTTQAALPIVLSQTATTGRLTAERQGFLASFRLAHSPQQVLCRLSC